MKTSIGIFLCVVFLTSNTHGQGVMEKYDSAILYAERAQLPQTISLFKEISDDLFKNKLYDEYFAGRYFLAVSYTVLDKNPQATEDSLKMNLKLAIELSGEKSLGVAEMYFGLGWHYDRILIENNGEDFYRRAYEIQEKKLDAKSKKLLKTKVNYATVLVENYNLPLAEKYLIEVLNTYPLVFPENHAEFFRLYTLAFQYYKSTNERAKALEYALAALRVGENNYSSNNQRLLRLFRNVSQAYHENNDITNAIEFANKEIDLIEKLIGNAPHLLKAQVMNNLGRFYEKIDLTRSTDYTQEALNMKIELMGRQHPSTINSMINLSKSLSRMGNIGESNQILKEAIIIMDELKVEKFNINYQRAMWVLSDNLTKTEDLDSVKSIVDSSFKIFHQNIGISLLAGDEHINMMGMIENLSAITIYENGSESALVAVADKIQWMDSINNQTLVKVNLKQDQLNFLRSYSAFNTVAVNLYYALYALSKKTEYLKKVLTYTEKNKATILSPEYTIARLKGQLKVPFEVLEKERALLSEIADLESIEGKKSLNKKLSYDSLKNYLKSNYPDYYALKYELTSPSIDEIQDQLKENEAILTYAITEKSLYTISLGRDKFDVEVHSNDSLQQMCEALRSGIVAKENIDKLSTSLYDILIPKDLPDSSSLVISTLDYLSFLPFELLQSNNQFLGITHSVSYTPSIDMWLKSKRFKPYTNTSILAMAPDFTSPSEVLIADANRDLLVPIPGAKEELEVLGSLFSGELLSGNEATRKNFLEKVSDHGMVHLATHAIVDNENSNHSRLYFTSSDDEESQFIYNHELYNLGIKANLVTLSACNTGVGGINKGDGPNSLARGFMYAGVPATVVSLWPASDKSTPELMKHFYQNLKEGQTKDLALNNARKQYLETATGKARHPFYWGGFVLIGDNSPIKKDASRLGTLLALLFIMTILPIAIVVKKRFLSIDQ